MDHSRSCCLFFATLVLFVAVAVVPAQAQLSFRCTTLNVTCNSLVGYITPNATTLSALTNRFNISDFRSFLGANNLDPSTRSNFTIRANETIVIPFPCNCNSNGIGVPTRPPIYTVVPNDGLDHIARDVFGALVTFQQIQAFNRIDDPNQILVGQQLSIPLPCSCDQVDGSPVVHYGHVVASGSSLLEIARQFNTTEPTLQTLNNLTDPKALQAGVVLDVPLTACASIIRNDSEDFPLLVSSGRYVSTARNCIRCRCNTSISSRLQCEPSQFNSSICSQIPPCELNASAAPLTLGNNITSGCNHTTCAYAGFRSQTIFTALDSVSTCPAPAPTGSGLGSGSGAISLLRDRTSTWNGLPVGVFIHALLLCIVFFFSS